MSFVIRVTPPPKTAAKNRDLLAQVLVRLGERFGLEGMQDWAVDIDTDIGAKGTQILGVESEFHDLSKLRAPQDFVLWFANRRRGDEFGKLVGSSFPELKVSRAAPTPQVDWVTKWKKYYKPVRIRANAHSPELLVLPKWIKRKAPLKILIDPGQAFGTGTHPTTQLCLKLALPLHPQRVLDFGAGTGILAMLAAKLGARQIHCIEIDPVAREQLKKNLALNRVKAKVKTKPQGQYDLVFANVLAPVLLRERRALLNAVKPGGILILSGILARESYRFMEDFLPPKRRQLALKTQGDWAAILIETGT